MTKFQKASLFLLRLALGWLMFYAGITKVLDPSWSAAGYLKGAATFAGFYQLLLAPQVLPVINFLNAWGLTLLGVSLIVGLGVRLSSVLGAALMLLYYFPVLTFPYIKPHSFLVDEHIVYILVLVYFAAVRAGRTWGLARWCVSWPICSKFPKVHAWLD